MRDVIVIGAGIGGLSAALALQRAGRTVAVFERAQALGEVGAGLTVGPNMMRGLAHLGVDAAVKAAATVPETGGVVDLATGGQLVANARGAITQARYGQPYAQVHRADLHAILVDAVRAHDPGALRLGQALASVTQAGAGVTARFAGGAEAQGRLLVAADGARSVVREQLFPGTTPRFTGYVAWRGLVPLERLPGLVLEPASAIMIGPRRSFARYRVGQGRLLNYAAFVESREWTAEGWSIPSGPEELLGHFRGCAGVVERIVRATPAGACFKWGLFDRDPLPAWTAGRVTLLGDAAHPMLPFLGQGAAMAVEDAVVLGRALAAQDGEAGLAVYERTRRERAAVVVAASRNAVREFHAADTQGYNPERHRDAEALGLFHYDPATVPLA